MKLLVTGADGFTGSHFIRHASAHGYEATPLQADLRDRDQVHAEVLQNAPEVVVHLAAISFVSNANVSDFYAVNVLGTLNLLDALVALPHSPKSVLLASTANIYGNCTDSPISEDMTPTPVNHYATSKLAMEHMARTYLDKLPLFFVRPFNYTGPGQSKSFIIPKLVSHFADRAPVIELGNLEVEREFNDVRFVCEAYFRLLEKAVAGDVYNICSGRGVALQSIIELLHRITGHTLEIRINPHFVRSNEIYQLYGNPKKLMDRVGEIVLPTVEETLHWMLEQE